MWNKMKIWVSIGLGLILFSCPIYSMDYYQNFKVAIYSRAYETREMKDSEWLNSRWEQISKYIPVNKIYLETYRDLILVDDETIEKAKTFFKSKGVYTSGGITLTVNERNRFETFCYSNPEHREKVKEIVEFTARHFDEIILDDFYFTNCKCELCIKAKGSQTWTQYRLDLLAEAAQTLIINPAKAVNPNVKVVIKYPNWYEHFQGLGFNLEVEPQLFDALYTGTETRDPSSNQHLQPYLGYLIFRYFENLKPGENLGGWVDTGGMRYLDRYAEQLWLTLFAKAPEMTLFDFRQMLRPVGKQLRADWQGQGTSFDFDEMIKPIQLEDGSWPENTIMALPAGYALKQVDPILKELGNPIAIKSYKPYHSTGEDFLQTYLGMIGIPMDLVSEFPSDEKMVVLTESAKFDPAIVEKMKDYLIAGNDVVITSGLLRALEKRGLDEIVELRYTDRKAVVKDFKIGWSPIIEAKAEMIIPQIQYLTNDSWEEISAMDETNGWPFLHSATYANGTLYVLTIPESFTDLYNLPEDVLSRIKSTVLEHFYVRVESPSKVSLFAYDNNTFIVESFLEHSADIRIVLDDQYAEVDDLISGETLSGKEIQGFWGRKTGKKGFETNVKPHSFRVFRCE